MSKNKVYYGDNLPILAGMNDISIPFIYIDPPFNTGKVQCMTRIRTYKDKNGDRIGFQGNSYRSLKISEQSYVDIFDDYIEFLYPRMREAYRILTNNGTLCFHIDCREVHYCKMLLDSIFGRECFLNEIIWAFDYGAKSKSKWSLKHNNILIYVKNPKDYVFNVAEMEREPYMAPGLVGEEKAARGKLPTDVWWHTIVPTNGRERTGYPTQKPLGVLNRLVRIHSNCGDTILDFFAGSGTTGEAAYNLNRNFIMIDNNIEAIDVMRKRFASVNDIEFVDVI